jgi:4-hydroxyacetophenone monooxygenase
VTTARATQPITESDDEIRAAVEQAQLAPLLAALALATGDYGLLEDDLRPDPARIIEPQGGLSDALQARARELATAAITAFRDGGCRPAPLPSDEQLARAVRFAMGTDQMDQYIPVLEEELALGGEDRRAPQWRKEEVAPDVDFRVAVIGAGMSGLLAAHRLDQAGVPYVILEKDADVGGTWLENSYPGCRVDVPNHLFSYSFAQKDDWPQHFSTQDVLLDYFRQCADELGIRPHIRFRTEVLEARWQEDRACWAIDVRGPEGTSETIEAQALISAVGQLNRPNMPEIAGMGTFSGPSFHSARWDHSVDLAGTRVAVIGTGASAAQFVPVIAEEVAQLTVFQRTPPWFFPTPDYHDPVEPGQRWLFTHVPYYSGWYRFWLFWASAEILLPAARVDPDWQPRDRSVGQANDDLRALLTEYIRAEFAFDADLCEQVLPEYPPASKRVLRDNGIWARTLRRDNVRLVTEGIAEIVPEGVLTKDGERHEVDVIIYGTGFQASRFLTPMKVVGRGGVDLHEQWDGDARAFMGITVPNFPNFFVMYGPNTNIVVNGSIIYFSECEVRYILGCLEVLLRGGHRAMEPRKDRHDEYNRRIDEGNLGMAWGVATVNSWYRNAKGRVAQNWPFSLVEYWDQTRAPDPTDYELA